MGIYITEKCPHCGVVLDRRRGVASNSTIGPKVMSCPLCRGQIKTGQSEWADKTAISRFGYYLRVLWWSLGSVLILGFGLGGLTSTILAFAVLKWDDDRTGDFFALYFLIAGIISLFCIVRTLRIASQDIKQSLKRKS